MNNFASANERPQIAARFSSSVQHLKRDLCISKETYVYQKRHMYIKRDLCISKETYNGDLQMSALKSQLKSYCKSTFS